MRVSPTGSASSYFPEPVKTGTERCYIGNDEARDLFMEHMHERPRIGAGFAGTNAVIPVTKNPCYHVGRMCTTEGFVVNVGSPDSHRLFALTDFLFMFTSSPFVMFRFS